MFCIARTCSEACSRRHTAGCFMPSIAPAVADPMVTPAVTPGVPDIIGAPYVPVRRTCCGCTSEMLALFLPRPVATTVTRSSSPISSS